MELFYQVNDTVYHFKNIISDFNKERKTLYVNLYKKSGKTKKFCLYSEKFNKPNKST